MRLCEELRLRRLELGLSQGRLAGMLGVSQQTISRWESGSTAPGPRRIAELATALGIEVGGLLRSGGYLLASDSARAQPIVPNFDEMTVAELVASVDAVWQVLRARLSDGRAV